MSYVISEWKQAQCIIINVSCGIICFRILLAYHAVLSLATRWSIWPLLSNVIGRYNPRNFVSDKLAINLFSYCNLQSIWQAFFVLKLMEYVFFFFSNFNNNKFTLNQLFNYSNTTVILNWKSTVFESVTITLVSSMQSIGKVLWINISGKFSV